MGIVQSLSNKLADNRAVRLFVQNAPVFRKMAARYVPADNAEGVLEIAKKYMADGFKVSLHHLGKFSKEPDEIGVNMGAVMEAVDLLDEERQEVCVSLTPAMLGSVRSHRSVEGSIKHIAQVFVSRLSAGDIEQRNHVATDPAHKNPAHRHCLFLDTDRMTPMPVLLALGGHLTRAGVPAVVTVSAALTRSEEDVKALIASRAMVRLVGLGGNCPPEGNMITDPQEVTENFIGLAGLLLSEDANIEGIRPTIVIDDPKVLPQIEMAIDVHGWASGSYEFELPFGVKKGLADKLLNKGHDVRIRIPFGHQWWPYIAGLKT